MAPALRRKIESKTSCRKSASKPCGHLPEAELGDREVFSWLCQLAERRIIDAHRRFFAAQKRDAGREVPLGTPGGDTQHAAIIDLLVASMTTPTQALSRNMKEVRLLEALATLPEDQREALRLRYLEGLPSKGHRRPAGQKRRFGAGDADAGPGPAQQMLGPDAMPR